MLLYELWWVKMDFVLDRLQLRDDWLCLNCYYEPTIQLWESEFEVKLKKVSK